MDINHNLELAKPRFLYFIKNMDKELSQWIQFSGVKEDVSSVYFNFKSSQNSLSFKVYAGVNIGNIHFELLSRRNEIYKYFRQLKYDNI